MIRAVRLFLTTCLLLAAAAHAADPAWRGLWRGTVGKQQVMVCLDQDDARYYYLRNPGYLALKLETPSGTRWTESSKGKLTGNWQLDGPAGGQLSGTWTAPKGGHALPIQLQRIAATDDTLLCSSPVFYAPRVEAQPVNPGKPRKFEGKQYRELSALKGDIVGLELLETAPTYAALNRTLKAQFLQEISNHFDCEASAEESEAPGADYSSHLQPVFWTNRWLAVAEQSEYFCGGAHPDGGYMVTTYDLAKGTEAKLENWLKLSKDEFPQGLRQLILRQAGNIDKDCADVLADNASYSIWPSRGGLAFYPHLPHVVAACADTFVVPYQALRPWLSPVGQAEVSALMAKP